MLCYVMYVCMYVCMYATLMISILYLSDRLHLHLLLLLLLHLHLLTYQELNRIIRLYANDPQ